MNQTDPTMIEARALLAERHAILAEQHALAALLPMGGVALVLFGLVAYALG